MATARDRQSQRTTRAAVVGVVRKPRLCSAGQLTRAHSGEKELYDHIRDPDQLMNLGPTTAGTVMTQLAALLHDMHGCQGQGCRNAEQMTPPP